MKEAWGTELEMDLNLFFSLHMYQCYLFLRSQEQEEDTVFLHQNVNSELKKWFHPNLVWCTRELKRGYLLEPGEFIVGHTQVWVL